jgi:hypothetical protein
LFKFASAIRHNTESAKKMWGQDDLPLPFCIRTIAKGTFGVDAPFCFPAETGEFAAMVAIFQKAHGLRVDGKLGSSTLAAMRSATAARPPGEDGHDFGEVKPRLKRKRLKPRIGVSNKLVINGRLVKISDEMISKGIGASNYDDDGEHQFSDFQPRDGVRFVVIHESVTMCVAETNRILKLKKMKSSAAGDNGGKGHDFGTHISIAPDGHIVCHADLVLHRLVHANQMNDESISIQVVNPYNPMFARPPFDRVIPGPWWCWKPEGAPKLYTPPTDAQLLSLSLLVEFLPKQIDSLPLAFPTKNLNAENRRIEGWDQGALPGSGGIVAHRDFTAHSGGRYLLEHCIEQMNKPLHARS